MRNLHHGLAGPFSAASVSAEVAIMAMKILDTCINCGSCEPECPNKAISQGDPIYVIAHERCTECVGAFDAPKCVELCPIAECIVVNPAEARDVLQTRYEQLHA
jgi:ferredoxin